MWEPIWASRFRYWLLTGNSSRSCLHSSRTRRVRMLNVTMTVILWVYMFWCTEGCSESQMWSGTWRGVSKWCRHEDWYIGSLCLDIRSVPQQWQPSQVLCVDVICTSRTQVSCGWYKSYCLPACHTLVWRYCWMKRPGPTLRVRLRETGSTDMLCTQVAGGCQFLQL